MTKYLTDPYDEVGGKVPRPKIRRSHSNESVMGAAYDAGGMLTAARSARQSVTDNPYSDYEPMNQGAMARPPMSLEDIRREANKYPQSQGQNDDTPFPIGYAESPEDYRRRVDEYNASRRGAIAGDIAAGKTTLSEGQAQFHPAVARQDSPLMATMGMPRTSSDPRGVTPEDIRGTAIFRPQAEVGGRPQGVADSVANDIINRAAQTGSQQDVENVARLAWQREASINGNPTGDQQAPQAYIDSWLGQVRAGEDAGPYANMLRQAHQQSMAARGAASAAQGAAEASARQGQQIRSMTPATTSTTRGLIDGALAGRPTAGEPGGPPLQNGPVWEPPYQQMPQRDVPLTPQSGGNYKFVDEVLAARNAPGATAAPVAASPTGGTVNIDNTSRATFVKTAWPHMLQAAGGNRDAAEMMLAAAISENGSVGTGKPFWANNFFGIKAVGNQPGTSAATWEKEGGARVNQNANFRTYNSPIEGFGGFFQFLEENSRYKGALDRYKATGDGAQLFRDINKAGYATDDKWAGAVENIRANQVAPLVKGM